MKMNDHILARWYSKYPNWGDMLNPVLINKISGKKAINLQHTKLNITKLKQILLKEPKPEYLAIGSILGWGVRRPNISIFWGSGFMYETEKVRVRPRKVCAVRGPLSREKLISQGIECPPIYGDPALLYPRFYSPNIESKYELGIIPHMADKNNSWVNKFKDNKEILIIDIQSGINNVVDKILNCKRVASSSLHGIIASDAYHIPSSWITLSNNVNGNGFKFKDYFASVHRTEKEPLSIKSTTSIEEVLNSFHEYDIEIDLDMLFEACPFKPENIHKS